MSERVNYSDEEAIIANIQALKDRGEACRTIRTTAVMLGFPQAASWTNPEIEQGCTVLGKALAESGLTVEQAARSLQQFNSFRKRETETP